MQAWARTKHPLAVLCAEHIYIHTPRPSVCPRIGNYPRELESDGNSNVKPPSETSLDGSESLWVSCSFLPFYLSGRTPENPFARSICEQQRKKEYVPEEA